MSPIAAARRQRALALLDLPSGDVVLDIGAGPGFLADEMALEVGASGRVAAARLHGRHRPEPRHACSRPAPLRRTFPGGLP
jgi:hypothetical protein